MEIERKFLVPDVSNLNLGSYEHKIIKQDYLYVDKLTAIRKRCIISNNSEKYKYTIKTGKNGISVNEIENEISRELYDNLSVNPKYNTIIKTRYFIPYIESLVIEIDVFEGIYDGIIFAEIEYESEEQAKRILLPPWFGKEISNLVTNSDMAMKPAETILELLNDKK